MKDKKPYAHMLRIAERIQESLAPACERIEIAGSLRRQKAEIGDIELIAVPRPCLSLFGEPTDLAEVDLLLMLWLSEGKIEIIKNGEKYKQIEVIGSQGTRYQVDLFLQPDPATWGVNMMLRTGSAEFSRRMVTIQSRGGLMPDHCTVRDARIWIFGQPQETPEEEDVFALYEMDFIEPPNRY